jgi:ankyrin repeat protein
MSLFVVSHFIKLLTVDISPNTYKKICNETSDGDLRLRLTMILQEDISLEQRVKALKFAIENKWTEAVALVIENGMVDPDILTNILVETNAGGNFKILKLLHQNGASLDTPHAPILLAKGADSGWAPFVSYLLDHVDSKYLDQLPPSVSPYPLLVIASKNNHLDVVKILCKRGAKLSGCNSGALLIGSLHNSLEVVNYLLKKNINVNACNKIGSALANQFGLSALANSSMSGHYEITKLLLKKNADPNIYDQMSLAQSILHNHPKIVKLLLGFGSDPNAIYEHPSVIEYICQDRSTVMLKILIGAGLDPRYGDDILFKKCTLSHNAEATQVLANPDSVSKISSDSISKISPRQSLTRLRQYSLVSSQDRL